MKVKCIREATYVVSDQRLIEGNIYEATQSPYSPNEYLINGVSWFKNRFVVISYEDEVVTSAPVTTTKSKKYNSNEECPCGLLSSQCDYHKSV
jgi:hypothetical protein